MTKLLYDGPEAKVTMKKRANPDTKWYPITYAHVTSITSTDRGDLIIKTGEPSNRKILSHCFYRCWNHAEIYNGDTGETYLSLNSDYELDTPKVRPIGAIEEPEFNM